MTKSKSFWAVLAVISLAASGFSGYSIYNRLAIYLANDTVEIKSRPVPPLPDPEEPAAAAKPEPKPESKPVSKPESKPAAKPADKETKDKEANQEPQKQKAVKTAFEYKNAAAKSVSLSGSFKKWEKIGMAKKNGVWKAEVYILPGTYLYHFTVDGKKTLDPGKAKAPTGESIAVVEEAKPAKAEGVK